MEFIGCSRGPLEVLLGFVDGFFKKVLMSFIGFYKASL